MAFPRDEAAYLQLALKLNAGGDPVEEPVVRLPALEKDSVVS